MPSTFSTRLRIEQPADGEQLGVWGRTTNRNLGTLIEAAIAGMATIDLTLGNVTLTAVNGQVDQARFAVLNFTGIPAAARIATVPAVQKSYLVINATSQQVTVLPSGGTGVVIPANSRAHIYVEGTVAAVSINYLNSLKTNSIQTTTLTGLQTPVNPTDGSNKGYVDAEIEDLRTFVEEFLGGAINFTGPYDPLRLYLIGESVSYLGNRFLKQSNAPAGTTPVEGPDWFNVDRGLSVATTVGLSQVVDFNENYTVLDLETGLTGSSVVTVSFTPDASREAQESSVLFYYPPFSTFDIGSAAYDDLILAVGAQNTLPTGIAFSADGTKLFVVGNAAPASVFQYSLPTPFTLTGATYDGVSLSVAGQNTGPTGIALSADGTKLFMVGFTATASVFQYSLPTPFRLTGAFYDSTVFSVAGQDTVPQGIAFSTDGAKFFIVGSAGDAVFQYTAPAPFRVGTQRYSQRSFSVATQNTALTGVVFSADGSKMFAIGATAPASVFQYSLPTPFTLTGATYDGVSLSVAAQTTAPTNFTISADGTKLFVNSVSTIYQYSLPTPFTLSGASYDGATLVTNAQNTSAQAITLSADGTKLFMVGATSPASVFQYSLPTPFSLTGASYDNISFAINGQEATPTGLALSADGTKLFTVGQAGDVVDQYSLPTPFSLSGAFFTGVEYSIAGQDAAPTGLALSADGTKLFMAGATGGTVYEYELETPFLIANASFEGSTVSVAAQDATPTDLSFSADGTKLFMVGSTGDAVYRYSLPTPFNLKGQTYENVSLRVAGQDLSAEGIAFSADGTKLFMVGSNTDSVYQYSTGAPFRLTGATYDGVSLSVAGQNTLPQGIAFSADGTKLFMVGATAPASVFQYSLPTPFTLTGATYDGVSLSVAAENTGPTGIAFSADGTRLLVVGSTAPARVFQYALPTPFRLTGAFYTSGVVAVTGQDTSPQGLTFNAEGTKLFIVGDTGNAVYQYSTPVPFRAAGQEYLNVSLSVAAQNTNPNGIAFSADGTKLFVVGNAAPASVFQYSLPTPFTLTGATYDGVSLAVNGQDTSPQGIALSADGTKLFMVGDTGNVVHQYSLPTPFTLTGATYDGVTLAVGAQNTVPTGIAFSADGTKLFMVGATTPASVFQYSLPTPFSLTGATYDGVALAVNGQDTTPTGIAFSADGTKLFMVGDVGNAVFQYTAPAPFTLTGAFYTGVSYSVNGQDAGPQGIAFSADGTKLFMVGLTNDAIYEYILSVPFALTFLSYDNILHSTVGQTASPSDVAFSADGIRLFVVGGGTGPGSTVFEYTMKNQFLFENTTYDGVSLSVAAQDAIPTGITFSADGTKLLMVGQTNDAVYQYTTTDEITVVFPNNIEQAQPITPITNTKNLYKFLTLDQGATYQLIDKTEGIR